MTVDKAVAEMHVGDTLLETQDQVQEKVIRNFTKDECMLISDFDCFVPKNNPIIDYDDEEFPLN